MARFAALKFAAKTSFLTEKALDLILFAFVSDIYRRVLGPLPFLSYWTERLYVGSYRVELKDMNETLSCVLSKDRSIHQISLDQIS